MGAALAYLASREFAGAETIVGKGAQLATDGPRRIYDFQPRETHFPAKAKAVIHLFMNGGPSQVDLFDPKPKLDKHHGEPYFNEIAQDVSSPEQAGG